MPELPEVETMRRGVLSTVGRQIVSIETPRLPLRPIRVEPAAPQFARRVAGARIAAIERVGKRVVIPLDSGDSLVFEPRMTGLVLLADPPDREHLRFGLKLRGRPTLAIWFWDRRGLGSVRLLTPEERLEQLGAGRLGPDALAVSPEELRAAFRESTRPVKVALLDQKRLAGVGNLYASEILHLARMHPAKPCSRITRAEWERIHAALREVLLNAIAHEGSTLSDGTYRNALNEPGGYQNHHRVYDREGERCPTCGKGEIVRHVQAQRSTFHCPKCQRASRPR